MRVPLSWLREHLPDLPAEVTGRQVADRLIAVGLEVETVDVVGGELSGPLVAGRITEITELTGFNKPIRFCRVDVGGEHNDADGARGIVCGARNFAAGEAVVVALPGAVLPGAHPGGHREITARKTYGHVSDGMICSEVELGVPGGDANGIIVLPAGTAAGLTAPDLLGLPEDVLDIAVTPDRGYALSVRGVAREVAAAFGLGFTDPAATAPRAEPGGHEVRLEDAAGCDRFVARVVTGLDPTRPSPTWLCRRLRLAGMRPLGLAVDVTNFVMLELGQPLHGYDRDLLRGPITVRRAGAGEKLQTLDGVTRDLDSEDLLITDDSGPIGLAGVMGGASTEISATTTAVLIEAAHFDPVSIARGARRHRLPSEASRRFERGVDPALAPAAAQRAVDLLVDLGGGSVEPAGADAGHPRRPGSITIDADLPARVAGRELDPATVTRRLAQIGADTDAIGARITVRVPSWRPDLTDPADLVEEVLRLEGYDSVPSVLPPVPAGRGLTRAQHQRRRIGRALAAAGLVETPCYPFIGDRDLDDLGLGAEDPRRAVLGLANPISEQQPNLRTTLLPGLLGALRRNVGRGNADVALFEIGTVFRPAANAPAAPRPPVDRRATDAELAAAEAALPRQPRRVAAVLAGHREPPGWWGPGRAASWSDALDAARVVAEAAGAELTARADEHPPWHPGRCAALLIAERVVGHAGELHPRCVNALDLPARTVAMELDLDAVAAGAAGGVEAPRISTYPPATRDVALIVETSVPAADVRAALHAGGGPLVESVRLFDVYAGEQVGAGRRSLAFALRFRAPDRTLTAEETTAARDAAIAEATARTGAELRG